jgi:hypothetical protein
MVCAGPESSITMCGLGGGLLDCRAIRVFWLCTRIEDVDCVFLQNVAMQPEDCMALQCRRPLY